MTTMDQVLALPKVDLHCHLTGTATADTFGDLARKAGLELPESPETIYRDLCSPPSPREKYWGARIPVPTVTSPGEPAHPYSLFLVSEWVRRSLIDAEDFERIAYEACINANRTSNITHLELFCDPHEDYWRLSYAEVQAAYVAGVQRAEREVGMTGRLIQAIDRSKSAEDAVKAVRQAVDHPHEYLVGIGLDNLETAGPPERFVDAYRLAGEAGLKRTAHSSEHEMNAHNTIVCLDDMGCDRIDHGYFILEDADVVKRCVDEQVTFTVASTTSRRSIRSWRRASIQAMVEAGCTLSLCDDDPGMFPTTLANEYRIAHEQIGLTPDELAQIVLNGWRACWLPDAEKARRAAEVASLLA
jgi:adenosine deaminase